MIRPVLSLAGGVAAGLLISIGEWPWALVLVVACVLWALARALKEVTRG